MHPESPDTQYVYAIQEWKSGYYRPAFHDIYRKEPCEDEEDGMKKMDVAGDELKELGAGRYRKAVFARHKDSDGEYEYELVASKKFRIELAVVEE